MERQEVSRHRRQRITGDPVQDAVNDWREREEKEQRRASQRDADTGEYSWGAFHVPTNLRTTPDERAEATPTSHVEQL